MEYIIIFALLAYVAFLQYQLMKKKLFLDGIVGKISKIESNWNKDQIIKFLKKLQNMNADFLVKEDKILNIDVLKFLFEYGSEQKSFVHYTSDKTTAERIMTEGFKFSGSFHKTAEPIVPNNEVNLVYKHNLRKYFGKYIVVLGVSKSLYELYEKELAKNRLSNYSVEQVLTEGPPALDENHEEIYLFPKEFIKGIIDYETGEIVKNEHFDSAYNPPVFMKNLEILAGEK